MKFVFYRRARVDSRSGRLHRRGNRSDSGNVEAGDLIQNWNISQNSILKDLYYFKYYEILINFQKKSSRINCPKIWFVKFFFNLIEIGHRVSLGELRGRQRGRLFEFLILKCFWKNLNGKHQIIPLTESEFRIETLSERKRPRSNYSKHLRGWTPSEGLLSRPERDPRDHGTTLKRVVRPQDKLSDMRGRGTRSKIRITSELNSHRQ